MPGPATRQSPTARAPTGGRRPIRSIWPRAVAGELAAATARLPERQREALALRELLGLSYDDIGAVVGLDPAAVAPLLARARLRLRTALRGDGPPLPPCDERERALRTIALRQDGEEVPGARRGLADGASRPLRRLRPGALGDARGVASATAPGGPTRPCRRRERARAAPGHERRRRCELGGPGRRPLLMGIVNATPDSFSDAGLHQTLDERVELARELLAAGADADRHRRRIGRHQPAGGRRRRRRSPAWCR